MLPLQAGVCLPVKVHTYLHAWKSNLPEDIKAEHIAKTAKMMN